MPIPELSEADRQNLDELYADLIERVYDHWKFFEKPLSYQIASASYNKRAKKAKLTMRTLIDVVVQMGYISKIPTSRGGHVLLPYGIWDQLPVYKKDTWRNPSKSKEEYCREIDSGRKVRLIETERDYPLYDELGEAIEAPTGATAPSKNQELPTVVNPQAMKDLLSSTPLSTPLLFADEEGEASEPAESVRGREDSNPRGSHREPE